MFGSMQNGAKAYANVGVETGVAAASPHALIVMLFEAAMVAVASAIQHMQSGDIEKKGIAISRAISIIDNGLRVSLDKKVGGDIALNLDALYEYMCTRLLIANANNQQSVLEEIHQLLKGLKSAWEAIAPAAPVTPPPTAEQQQPPAPTSTSAYDALAPHTTRLVKA